jgi:hypothetical protein
VPYDGSPYLSCPVFLALLALADGSALALLVARVGTQDAHHAFAAHNLAILADLFY